ncbi:MAG: AgmX/PglI C-terminal domain-containing protein [bacterium]
MKARESNPVPGTPEATQRATAPPVPIGMEQVLLMAGVHEGFSQALVRDPQRSAEAGAVALTATERAMLRSVDEAAIRRMAVRVAEATDEPTRRVFLTRASGAMATLAVGTAGAAGLPGCGSKKADSPANKSSSPEAMEGGGETAETMRPQPIMRERMHRINAPTGIRPNPTPRIYANTPKVTGPLESRKVRGAVWKHLQEIRTCWLPQDWRMRRQPQGKLHVELTIDPKGRASGVRVLGDTLRAPQVEKCVLKAIPTWQFPASGTKKTVAEVEFSFVVSMFP